MSASTARRTLSAALLCSVISVAAACGAPGSHNTVVADGYGQEQPAAATTAPPAPPAVVASRKAKIAAYEAACPAAEPSATPPPTVPGDGVDPVTGTILVGGGPECLPGRVSSVITSMNASEIPQYVPIYDLKTNAVIGYWAQIVGWVTPQEKADPSFNLADEQAAVLELSSGTGQGGS